MDPLKTRDKKKHFRCFQPVTLDAALPNSIEYECLQRTKSRPSFATALKSVLVKSFLGMKLQRKKPKKDSTRSNSELSSESEKPNTLKKIPSHTDSLDSGGFFTTNTNSSATTSRRSSISSSSDRIKGLISLDSKETINSTNTDKPALKRDGTRRGFNPTTIGMFIFLVGLLALVLGGKPFAILICTSMCLFFAPRRRSQRDESLVSQVIDSDEYKKRVIMEGMLERNRSRVMHP